MNLPKSFRKVSKQRRAEIRLKAAERCAEHPTLNTAIEWVLAIVKKTAERHGGFHATLNPNALSADTEAGLVLATLRDMGFHVREVSPKNIVNERWEISWKKKL